MVEQPTAFPLLVVLGQMLTTFFACVIGPQWLGFAVTALDRQGKHLWVARLGSIVSGAAYIAVVLPFFLQEAERMPRAGENCATPIMVVFVFALGGLVLHFILGYEFQIKRMKVKQSRSQISSPANDPSLPLIIK